MQTSRNEIILITKQAQICHAFLHRLMPKPKTILCSGACRAKQRGTALPFLEVEIFPFFERSINSTAQIVGRVIKASASGAVVSGLIPSHVKSMTSK